jgi:hypothetical protein
MIQPPSGARWAVPLGMIDAGQMKSPTLKISS